ncbi:MAG: ATP-binding cassette domain-containing protein, partial [Actinobacteria bacterium]
MAADSSGARRPQRRGARRRPLVARGRGAPAAADADAPAAAAASERASLPRDEAPTVLQCRGVSVRFGGLQALGEVDLDVREGETVGLIGPNGAGKTTLMECVSGFQPVTEGAISYRGADLLHHAPGDRARLGIGRTLQNVRLFPYLTVVDNIRIALHRHERSNPVSDAF